MEYIKVSDLQEKYNDSQKNVWKKHIKLFYYFLKSVNKDYTYDYFTSLIYKSRGPNNDEDITLLKLFDFIQTEMFANDFIKTSNSLFSLIAERAVNDSELRAFLEIEMIINQAITITDLALIMVKLESLFVNIDYPNNYFAVFILFNRILVDLGINNIYLTLNQALKLKELSTTDETTKLGIFTSLLEDVFEKDLPLPLSYLENLIPLATDSIIEGVISNKEFLQTECFANAVYLYGSFAKGNERTESDIDLAVSFAEDITYLQKEKARLKIKEKLFTVFHRFIDVNEIFQSNDQSIIEMIGQNIKIY